MIEKNRNRSANVPPRSEQDKHWYRQVAGATLAAGASLVGQVQHASGAITAYTSGETAGPGVQTSPGWQIQALYFDFKTGNTFLTPIFDTWIYDEGATEGHGLPTTEMLPPGFPDAYQFGVARVGPIAALFSPVEQGEVAVNNQAMVRVDTWTWTSNTDNGETIVHGPYDLLKPLKLGQGEVIGAARNFMPKGPRTGSTGLDMQTMAAAGDWASSSPGYLGLKFSDDGVNYHYGWAEVSVDSQKNQTLLRFGYNKDLNESILAGQSDDADFDADGDVDGADLLAWQSGLGTATGALISSGDADQDGAIDGDDLALWKSGFGMGTSIVPTTSAIPEPSTTALLVVGAAGLGAYRRVRERRGDCKDAPKPRSS